MANQKGVSFSISDDLTDPRVALFKQKYYARIGLWTSLAVSKTIVPICLSLKEKSVVIYIYMQVNDEEVITSYLVRKPCASQHDPNRYQHLVPGFDNYTEGNCKYAVRQRLVNEMNKCYMVSLPYKGIYSSNFIKAFYKNLVHERIISGNLPACRPGQLLKLGKMLMTNQMNFKDPAADKDTGF